MQHKYPCVLIFIGLSFLSFLFSGGGSLVGALLGWGVRVGRDAWRQPRGVRLSHCLLLSTSWEPMEACGVCVCQSLMHSWMAHRGELVEEDDDDRWAHQPPVERYLHRRRVFLAGQPSF